MANAGSARARRRQTQSSGLLVPLMYDANRDVALAAIEAPPRWAHTIPVRAAVISLMRNRRSSPPRARCWSATASRRGAAGLLCAIAKKTSGCAAMCRRRWRCCPSVVTEALIGALDDRTASFAPRPSRRSIGCGERIRSWPSTREDPLTSHRSGARLQRDDAPLQLFVAAASIRIRCGPRAARKAPSRAERTLTLLG